MSTITEMHKQLEAEMQSATWRRDAIKQAQKQLSHIKPQMLNCPPPPSTWSELIPSTSLSVAGFFIHCRS